MTKLKAMKSRHGYKGSVKVYSGSQYLYAIYSPIERQDQESAIIDAQTMLQGLKGE